MVDDFDLYAPSSAETREQLTKCLEVLRIRTGLSLRDFEKSAYGCGLALSRATASRIESGSFPSRYQLRVYLAVCQVAKVDGIAWEESWSRLAHMYPRGRKTPRVKAQTRMPPLVRAPRVGSHGPILSDFSSVELLEAALKKTSSLEHFVCTGDGSHLPKDPRMELRIELKRLDRYYFSSTLITRVAYKGALSGPKFYIFASAMDVPYGVSDLQLGPLLYEWWNVAEEDLFAEFANTIRETVGFKVASLKDHLALEQVRKDAIRELTHEELRLHLPIADQDLEIMPIRAFEVDLGRLSNNKIADSVDVIEMQATSIYRDEPLNYISWTPASSAFLETAQIVTSGFPQGLELLRIVNIPGGPFRFAERTTAKEITVDTQAWIIPGHGITVAWPSSNH